MDHSEIVNRVNQTLHSGFEIAMEDLKPESNLFTDLHLDSLDAVDLMVHLEDNLGIKVEGDIFKNVRTLGDVYTMVEGLAQSV